MMRYGDCRKLLADVEPGSVQLAFTSSPYYSQREYGEDPGEIGWGSPEHYLSELGEVLDALGPALDLQGSSWWVMGDKAAGSGGAGGDHLAGKSKDWIAPYGKADADVPDGQWLMMPYRFARMAQQRGWLVRSIIVWDKSPTVKPEQAAHVRRPLVSTERIIVLAKQVDIRWYPQRLIEPADVWHIRPHRGPKADRHYAPFPAELPKRAILACTERGHLVLDPFAGTGTTVHTAVNLGRSGLGMELYPPAGRK